MDNSSNDTYSTQNNEDIKSSTSSTGSPDDKYRIKPDINKNRFRANSRYLQSWSTALHLYSSLYLFLNLLVI